MLLVAGYWRIVRRGNVGKREGGIDDLCRETENRQLLHFLISTAESALAGIAVLRGIGDRLDVHQSPFVEKLGNVPSVPSFATASPVFLN
jgi:hypothetical protein